MVLTLFSEILLDLVEGVDQQVLEMEETVVQVVAHHGQVLTPLEELLREIHLLATDMEMMVVNH
jgi:predicted AlkP superfamily pyrophosphatase or phosphodiesterase